MTTPLDSIRALREMVEAGTPGPWTAELERDARVVAVAPYPATDHGDDCDEDCDGTGDGHAVTVCTCDRDYDLGVSHDAALIVAMHEALPALLAVAEAAEAFQVLLDSPAPIGYPALVMSRSLGEAAARMRDALSALGRVKGGGR